VTRGTTNNQYKSIKKHNNIHAKICEREIQSSTEVNARKNMYYVGYIIKLIYLLEYCQHNTRRVSPAQRVAHKPIINYNN